METPQKVKLYCSPVILSTNVRRSRLLDRGAEAPAAARKAASKPVSYRKTMWPVPPEAL